MGGFARVYHAIDPDLELDVAVKVLRPELAHDADVVERFRREAMTAAKLRHPHVITVLTVGRLTEPFDGIPAGAPYLVMDYLPHSLADRLSARDGLPDADVARIGAEVARGLAYAHRQGIVHRDVKPENVLFARDGRAVVTDFGIARALSAAPSGPSRQVLLGTPAYFSPEQARGLPLDGRSDLYSLGVTLYRAATGGVPFASEDWYVVMRQHVEETPPPPSEVHPEISPAFDAALARALAKDPAARFPTGDAMAEALDAIRGAPGANRHNTTEIPRVASGAPSARVRRWRRVGAALAAASVAVAGARILAVRGTVERVPRPPTVPAATTLSDSPATARTVVVGATAAGAPALPTAAAVPNASPAAAAAVVASLARSSDAEATRQATTGGTVASREGRTPRVAEDTPTRAGRPRTSPAAGNSVGLPLPLGTGTLTVFAPAEADVYVAGALVGRGTYRSAPLPAGRYSVRASLGGLPGCASSDTAAVADLPARGRRTLTLTPVACGRLLLDVSATNAPHYTLEPVNGGAPTEGVLPLGRALVLPDGRYRLTVQARACAQYVDTIPVVAGTTRRESHALICQ